MKRKLLLLALLVISLGALSLGSLGLISNTNSQSPEAPKGGTIENSEWRLIVDGFVQDPLNLTFDELVEMPRSTVNAELYCVDYPTNIVAKGNWTGVRIGLLLETAGVSPEAVKVAFYAEDGFTTDLTVMTATREDIILAYEKDGEPLTEKIRLVVPGKWGYKWIHGVNHIELVDYDFKGFWESRGYSDTAEISEES